MAAASLPFCFSIFFFMFSRLPNTLQAAGGFSVDLIHRDSPSSPFYDPLDTISDRITRAVRRSNSRTNYIRSTSSASPNAITSTVVNSGGEYLMTVALGTPPVKFLAIADTGSDLIWTQCSPCTSCYKQDVPLFNPKGSSTYCDLSCSSKPCSLLPESTCSKSERCQYAFEYGDRSITKGVLAAETLTMTSTGVKIPKVLFGCGHNNNGSFDSHGAGLVGLGRGPLSLISQLSSSIQGMFSYCLVPLSQETSCSRMDFGVTAIVSGEGAVSTPLISKSDSEIFYYVTLLKITVGEKCISVPEAEQSNFIVDSGTTLTYLPSSVHGELVSAVKDSISLPPAQDPTEFFNLCYETGANCSQLFDLQPWCWALQVPELKFGFDGAEITLNKLNTFVQVSENVACFAFLASASTDYTAIIGNTAQINFKVGYDLNAMKLTFQPTNCAAL